MDKFKTKQIIKKVMLLLFTTIILVLCGEAFSETAAFMTSGSKWIGYSDLAGSSNLYCIAYNASLRNGRKLYHVGAYRKIVGKTLYNGTGAEISTSDPNLNAEFAYILGGGNYAKGYGAVHNYTIRQKSVYNIFNNWANNAGLSGWTRRDNRSFGRTSLTAEAENYANNFRSSGEAYVSSLVGGNITTSNTNAGPFKFKYSGNITSITVEDEDGNAISSGIKFVNNEQNEIKASDIKSEQEFYIANTSDKKLGKITVNVSAEGTLTAEISLLRAGRNQKLMMVDTSTSSSHASASVKIKTYGSLTLNKIDADTGEKLDAGFKIQTSKGGWLKGSKGSYTYNASEDDATIYRSGKLEELDFDTYNVYEVEAPAGYDLSAQVGYDGSKVLVKTVVLDAKSDEDSQKTNNFADKIKYVAHKGIHDSKDYASTHSGAIPENSYAAFKKAAQDPDIYAIEADLYTTSDGKFVMFHDSTLNSSRKILKIDNGYTYLLQKGIPQISSNKLQHVHLSNGEPLPTLEQYLSACKSGNKIAVLEVKNVKKSKLNDMMNIIKNYGMFDKTILISQTVVDGKSYLQYIAEHVQGGKEIKMMVLKHNHYTAVKNSGANLIGEDLGIVATKKLVSENKSIQNLAGLWTLYADGQGSSGQTLADFKAFIENVYSANPPNFQYITIDDKATMNEFKQYLKEKYSPKDTGVTTTSTDATISIPNEKVISISGYVWEDKANYKINDTDNEFGEGESKIPGVKVELVNKATNEVIDTKVTDANGQYKFDGHDYIREVNGKKYHLIKEATITNYYIRFDYSGYGKDYIPVAFNSTDASKIEKNGSRAIMDNVATKDVDLSGIATTYTGTSEETTYGLGANGNLYKKLYVAKDYTLANINLGIKQLPKTDYHIDENLAYVDITMKGYTYRYNYGGTGNKSLVAAPRVNFQKKNNIRAFDRAVYPSDVIYDKANSTEELKINVVYRIDITNTTNYALEELYREKKLYVTSLTNIYDNNRYTLVEKDNRWKSKLTQEHGYIAEITPDYLNTIYGSGIEKNNTATSFIEFSVNHDAILSMLDSEYGTQKGIAGIIENFPTKTISVAHHEYTRKDYSWQNAITKEQTHITKDDQQEAEAPYLIFKFGEQREISGNVFEDTVVSTNGEKLGDGQYEQEKENRVGGVKVELLDAKEGASDITQFPVSHVYGKKVEKEEKITWKTISEDASITTAEKDGSYTLTGIVPGKYYLRYTYANGKQIIYDTSGNEVSKDVNVKNYKSTIVKSNVAKAALQGSDQDGLWYKNLEDKNYSVAVDNMNSVAKAQDEINGIATVEEVQNKQNSENGFEYPVMAGTAMISITVENTEVDNKGNGETNVKYVQDENMLSNPDIDISQKTVNNGTKRTFPGFNFGIIKRPEIDLETDKKITNMRLVNAQGNVIFDGNPETGNLAGVSDLDYAKNEGSSFARIEMDENQLYGSTLTLTYTIIITNNSDVNYYGEKYYWFGEDKNNQVTVTPQEVRDYLDTTLTYMSVSKGKTVNQDKETKKIIVNNEETERKLLRVSGFKALYTTKNSNNDNKDCQDSVEITAQRVLSSNDNDMILYNTEILANLDSTTADPKDSEASTREQELKVVETNYDNVVKEYAAKELVNTKEFESMKLVSGATATITPPTGADRISPLLYIATGAIALVILSLGVVIIKKKILK